MENNLLSSRIDFVECQLRRLARHFGFDAEQTIVELLEASHLCSEVETNVRCVDGFIKKEWLSPAEFGLFRLALFVLVKNTQAKKIVETGVLHGFTSLLLLEAIKNLDDGALVSIDLPSKYGLPPANKDGYNDTLPENCNSGWVVPERLKMNWELIFGHSVEVLKNRDFTNEIDIFVHDSEHTYETMMSEFHFAWSALKPGGVLVVDNVEANNSLADFSIEVDKSVFYLPSDTVGVSNSKYKSRVGIIKK
jgi:predicted O-methyltransferase YrrM